MSLIPVPVCFGCAKSASLSLSCSDCLHIYCGNCFGLQQQPNGGDSSSEISDEEAVKSFVARVSLLLIRTCSKCTIKTDDLECTTVAICEDKPSQREDIDPTNLPLAPPAVKVKEERCWTHGKEMNLFCLTCDVIICGDCFLGGAKHMRHQIDFLETIFREKRVETRQKLDRLEQKVGVLQREALHCESNLELIQSAEKVVHAEIDAICEEAKMSVARLTMNRKRKLEARAGFPAKKRKLTTALQTMIEHMGPGEFFQQQAEVYKQCDELLSDCHPKGFQVLKYEDVGCELVPPYQLEQFTLSNFDGTFGGWPQFLNASSETKWNVFLRKNESLFVKVTPDEPEAAKHPYKLLVQIPHPKDIRKTITKTFTVHGPAKEDEIVTIEQLKAEDFIRNKNELVVKIGLRPLNAITENRFLKARYRALRDSVSNLKKEVTVSGEDMNCKFCIMYFNVCMPILAPKTPEPTHSFELVDQQERQWCLRVYPFPLTPQGANLKVFLVLRKGTRTKCRYFIELLHDDPKKNVIQCTESSFDTMDAGYGWHCFMERTRLLADTGYYPKAVLRFRFGVLPGPPA